MGSLVFFIKTLVMTFIIVSLLQIKVGQQSLEEKGLDWVYNSELTVPLREVAEGGVKVIRDAFNTVTGSLNTGFMRAINSKQRPGQRLEINLDRSKEYIKEKAEKAAQKVKDELKNEGILEEVNSTEQ